MLFFKLLTYFFLSLQTHWLTNHWLWTWDHFWGGINTINGPSTWKLCFLSFKPLHIRVCFDLLVPSQVFCPVRLIETMNMANSCIIFQIVSICLHSWNLILLLDVMPLDRSKFIKNSTFWNVLKMSQCLKLFISFTCT